MLVVGGVSRVDLLVPAMLLLVGCLVICSREQCGAQAASDLTSAADGNLEKPIEATNTHTQDNSIT